MLFNVFTCIVLLSSNVLCSTVNIDSSSRTIVPQRRSINFNLPSGDPERHAAVIYYTNVFPCEYEEDETLKLVMKFANSLDDITELVEFIKNEKRINSLTFLNEKPLFLVQAIAIALRDSDNAIETLKTRRFTPEAHEYLINAFSHSLKTLKIVNCSITSLFANTIAPVAPNLVRLNLFGRIFDSTNPLLNFFHETGSNNAASLKSLRFTIEREDVLRDVFIPFLKRYNQLEELYVTWSCKISDISSLFLEAIGSHPNLSIFKVEMYTRDALKRLLEKILLSKSITDLTIILNMPVSIDVHGILAQFMSSTSAVKKLTIKLWDRFTVTGENISPFSGRISTSLTHLSLNPWSWKYKEMKGIGQFQHLDIGPLNLPQHITSLLGHISSMAKSTSLTLHVQLTMNDEHNQWLYAAVAKLENTWESYFGNMSGLKILLEPPYGNLLYTTKPSQNINTAVEKENRSPIIIYF